MKGIEKKKLLGSLLRWYDIIELSTLGCRSLKLLSEKYQNTPRCVEPSLHNAMICAVKNLHFLRMLFVNIHDVRCVHRGSSISPLQEHFSLCCFAANRLPLYVNYPCTLVVNTDEEVLNGMQFILIDSVTGPISIVMADHLQLGNII